MNFGLKKKIFGLSDHKKNLGDLAESRENHQKVQDRK